MRKQIHLEDIVQATVDSNFASKYHVMPGIVSTYYPGSASAPASVDVQPAVNDVRFDKVTGARFSEPFPVVPKVPILFLYVGPYIIAGPMSPGDKVVLLSFDLDPTAHIQSGMPADPADTRRHAGSYWCAIPGDITTPDAFTDGAAIAQGLVIGTDGGQDQIRFTGGKIQLGATGGDYVALASLVAAELGKIKTTLASLTGATFGTPYSAVGNIASSLLKAQ